MPYRMVYEPAPKHLSMPVLKALPDGIHELRFSFNGIREASGMVDDHIENYHFCPRCGGWIEGSVNEYEVNTMGPLSGRQGTEYYCRRCGEEIGYIGAVS